MTDAISQVSIPLPPIPTMSSRVGKCPVFEAQSLSKDQHLKLVARLVTFLQCRAKDWVNFVASVPGECFLLLITLQ